MLIGAGLIFGIAFIPYASMTCCLPSIIGALVAVHLYTRKYGLTLTYGKGIKLGVLTCLMGGLAAWAVGIWVLTCWMLGKGIEWGTAAYGVTGVVLMAVFVFLLLREALTEESLR